MKAFGFLAGIIALTFGSLTGVNALASTASNYPNHAIRAVVPFPAGGINDLVARMVFEKLAKTLDGKIIIDNRPGAGGMIGSKLAVDSAPDGYTVLLGAASSMVVAPNMYSDATYHPKKDLIPIGGIGSVASVMCVPASSPFKTLGDLVAAAKARPDALNFGSAGIGTSHHMQTALLELRTGIHMTHVPYKGGAPAMTDLIGGQIQLLLEPLPTAVPHIKSGAVRALGVTTKERSPLLPDVPTFMQAGIKDYEASTWFGAFVPVGTPPPIVKKLSDALIKTLDDPALKTLLQARGIEPMPMNHQTFAKFVSSENDTWKRVIEQGHLQVR
jgi:tripartite-type tricarboxylate transporter receptor subunit TctC